MADVGPSLNWDEEDLDRLSDPTDRDVSRAKGWNRRHMPAPFYELSAADGYDTEEEAQDAATGNEDE
jgi:hypothetical protein